MLNRCSCLMVKPHIIEQGRLGPLIQAVIESGAAISALQMFYLDRATCDEFFEVYKVL